MCCFHYFFYSYQRRPCVRRVPGGRFFRYFLPPLEKIPKTTRRGNTCSPLGPQLKLRSSSTGWSITLAQSIMASLCSRSLHSTRHRRNRDFFPRLSPSITGCPKEALTCLHRTDSSCQARRSTGNVRVL